MFSTDVFVILESCFCYKRRNIRKKIFSGSLLEMEREKDSTVEAYFCSIQGKSLMKTYKFAYRKDPIEEK